MAYSDWYKMVGGLMEDTPLGQVVMLRKERDPKVLRQLTPSQRAIRAEWAAFRARTRAPERTQADMQQLQRMIAAAFGGR